VLNALKFTSEGKVTVEASAQMDTSLEIRIRDTGIGMRPEEVSEVLEGFKQGPRASASAASASACDSSPA
jgi:signal transduction histidine kinase